MWINAVVKFFSRPALQSESSPPWIFSTFAKRFTSISCRKQTRYFSAYSGDPLLANMFGPYSYLTTCFLKAVALQGTHPSRPKNSTIGGLVAMSKLHPGGEEPNNLEWNVCVCACDWRFLGFPNQVMLLLAPIRLDNADSLHCLDGKVRDQCTKPEGLIKMKEPK